MKNRMKELLLVSVVLVGFTSYAASNIVDDYKKACLKQDAQGCASLGWAYADGIPPELSSILPKEFLEQHLEQNYELAKEFLEIGCDYEVGDGCSKLGEMYAEGKGVEKNDSKAREYYGKAKEYYKKACDLNGANGCYSLGLIYEGGKGVKRDYIKAKEYYEKACNLNDDTGCFALGLMYETGTGVKRDYARAREYFKDLDAAFYSILGMIYEQGEDGIEKNDTKAREYYKKACDLGDDIGCAEYKKNDK